MGIAIIICMALVAVWAAWVAWEVTKAGGIPPYQDNAQYATEETPQERFERTAGMTPQEYAAQWPFPGDRA